jgi:predicted nucleic acid-binding protein
MAMHVFIDTNVYLNFFHHTNDDVASLLKLKDRIESQEIVLHLPEQVKQEFERNRDNKLQTALKEFKAGKIPNAIPRHMDSLSMAKNYRDSVKTAEDARKILIAQAVADARLHKLEVDQPILALLAKAVFYPHDKAIFEKGKWRAELGNPPEKKDSLGDQYNWEMLLEKLPHTDLYIVSVDGDYTSSLTEDSGDHIFPNSFLQNEWKQRKSEKSIYVFDTIKKVLQHYEKVLAPKAATTLNIDSEHSFKAQDSETKYELHTKTGETITLNAENISNLAKKNIVPVTSSNHLQTTPTEAVILTQEDAAKKQAAISSLIHSSSFSSTHEAIAQLRPYEASLTAEEANELMQAAIDNNQIRWIMGDSDVNDFYLNLFAEYLMVIDNETLDRIIDLLRLNASPDDFEDLDDDRP